MHEQIASDLASQGQRVGDLEVLHEMSLAQEKGDSFSEFMHKFNSGKGVDTMVDSDGTVVLNPDHSRMHRQSKWAQYWDEVKSSGGSSQAPFNEQEMSYFDNIPDAESTYNHVVRESERTKFLKSPQHERLGKIMDEHQKLNQMVNEGDAHFAPKEAVVNSLVRSINPVNLAGGLAGGIVADQTIERLDPKHELQPQLREGITGASAGVIAEGGAAALASGVAGLASAPIAISAGSGAAGYIAGGEVSKAVGSALQKSGANEDTVGSVSSIAGGATGGAVTSATGLGLAAALGSDVLIGSELGAAAGPVGIAAGAGLGSVVGLGGWLISKAIH